MKSWLETAGSMDDGPLPCMLAEPREALLPITGRENLAPRKRERTLEPCALAEEAYLSSGGGSLALGFLEKSVEDDAEPHSSTGRLMRPGKGYGWKHLMQRSLL